MRNDSQEWFEAFERGNRFEKHMALVCMPCHQGIPASSKVRQFLNDLPTCGLCLKPLPLPNGRIVRRRNFCNHPLCPKCRPFVNKRDANRGWQRFIDAIGLGFDAADFSFVSVNGSTIDPSDPSHTRATSDRRIKRYLEDLGSPLLCYGRYELTRRDDRQLRLDWHFVCYHPGVERNDLADHLRSKFTECRAVNVKPIRGGERGLKKNIKKVLRYSGKMHISGKKAKNDNIDELVELISTYEQIRSDGLKGLRFEFGFRAWTDENAYRDNTNSAHREVVSSPSAELVGASEHDIAGTDHSVLDQRWSFNYGPTKELVRVGPIVLRPPDVPNRIYPDLCFFASDHPTFHSQARAPPTPETLPKRGAHPALDRCAENPCGFTRVSTRVSAGLIGEVWLYRNQLIFAQSDDTISRMIREKRVALYLRVSTDHQTIENQRRDLEEVANRLGWNVVLVVADEGVSGAKGRDRRPGFDKLHKAVTRREIDLIAAWSVDRLGRSLQDLVGFLGEINARGVDLYLHKQGLDTSTPAGRAMFGMLGVFAEFERAMISERVKSGLERAKASGKKLGRPSIPESKVDQIRQALSDGKGIHRICRELGVGSGTVQRIKATP